MQDMVVVPSHHALPCIQCLHGLHGCSNLHMGSEILTMGSWQSQYAEVVASFCYLGDMLSAAGGCELSTTTCVKTAWKKFKDLLPVLSSCHLSFKHVAVCIALVCGVQCSMQSRQPLTYRLMESVGWEAQDDMETADREELQRMEALGHQPS